MRDLLVCVRCGERGRWIDFLNRGTLIDCCSSFGGPPGYHVCPKEKLPPQSWWTRLSRKLDTVLYGDSVLFVDDAELRFVEEDPK